MQNFIVLGLVPGTNIQLDFSFWIAVAIGLTVLACLPRAIRVLQEFRRSLVIRQVARRIERLDMIAL